LVYGSVPGSGSGDVKIVILVNYNSLKLVAMLTDILCRYSSFCTSVETVTTEELVNGILVRVGLAVVGKIDWVVVKAGEASGCADSVNVLGFEDEVSGALIESRVVESRGSLAEGVIRKVDVLLESNDVEATVFDTVIPAKSKTDEVEKGSDMTVFSGKILDTEEYFEAIEIKGDNKTVVVDALPKVFKS
jgi:hypothetical protein